MTVVSEALDEATDFLRTFRWPSHEQQNARTRSMGNQLVLKPHHRRCPSFTSSTSLYQLYKFARISQDKKMTQLLLLPTLLISSEYLILYKYGYVVLYSYRKSNGVAVVSASDNSRPHDRRPLDRCPQQSVASQFHVFCALKIDETDMNSWPESGRAIEQVQ